MPGTKRLRKSEIEQVKNGLRMGFGAVAGLCTMIVLGYGLGKLRHPETDNSLFTFLKGYPPLLVGSISVIIAMAILWTTMHRWAKILSGLFAYAVIGGLLAVAAGGWHSSIPALRLTRSGAAIASVLYAACSVLTFRFRSGRLNIVDRIVVLAAPLCLIYAADSGESATDFWMLGTMVAAFGIAALMDLARRKRMAYRDRRPVRSHDQDSG